MFLGGWLLCNPSQASAFPCLHHAPLLRSTSGLFLPLPNPPQGWVSPYLDPFWFSFLPRGFAPHFFLGPGACSHVEGRGMGVWWVVQVEGRGAGRKWDAAHAVSTKASLLAFTFVK